MQRYQFNIIIISIDFNHFFILNVKGISAAYVSMRSKQNQKNLPVTARSLETLIRLSSANAKARLSPSVDDEDVETAVELMNFVLFHEIGDASAGPSNGADSRGNLMGEEHKGRKGRGGQSSVTGEEERIKRARYEQEIGGDQDGLEDGPGERNFSTSMSASASAVSASSSSPNISSANRTKLLEIISNFVSDVGECSMLDFLSHLQTNHKVLYDHLYSPSMAELILLFDEFQTENQVRVFNFFYLTFLIFFL